MKIVPKIGTMMFHIREQCAIYIAMNVVAFRALKLFWSTHPQAKAPLIQWYEVARNAEWKSPQDIRNDFRSADFVTDNRVIFNIGGNKYRLIVHVSYEYKNMLVELIGTHKEYDAIDPSAV